MVLLQMYHTYYVIPLGYRYAKKETWNEVDSMHLFTTAAHKLSLACTFWRTKKEKKFLLNYPVNPKQRLLFILLIDFKQLESTVA